MHGPWLLCRKQYTTYLAPAIQIQSWIEFKSQCFTGSTHIDPGKWNIEYMRRALSCSLPVHNFVYREHTKFHRESKGQTRVNSLETLQTSGALIGCDCDFCHHSTTFIWNTKVSWWVRGATQRETMKLERNRNEMNRIDKTPKRSVFI